MTKIISKHTHIYVYNVIYTYLCEDIRIYSYVMMITIYIYGYIQYILFIRIHMT